MDPQFIRQLRDSFRGLGLNADEVVYIVLVFAAIGAVLLLGLAVNMIRKRYSLKDIPTNWVVNPLRIRTLLDAAVTQRCTIEMRFQPVDEKRRAIPCLPVDVTPRRITVEINHPVNAHIQWVERPVECTFRIRDKRGNVTSYLFNSSIRSLSVQAEDRVRMELETPGRLEQHQQRSCLRIHPPENYMLGAALWPEDRLPVGQTSVNMRKWGKPPLAFVPGHAINSLTIKDICAAGIRLVLSKEQMERTGVPLGIGERFVLLLDVYDPAAEERKRYLLKTSVRNFFEDYNAKHIEMGLHFRHWGRVQGETKTVYWVPLSPEGIDPLSRWILQRHMELHRQSDEEEDDTLA